MSPPVFRFMFPHVGHPLLGIVPSWDISLRSEASPAIRADLTPHKQNLCSLSLLLISCTVLYVLTILSLCFFFLYLPGLSHPVPTPPLFSQERYFTRGSVPDGLDRAICVQSPDPSCLH